MHVRTMLRSGAFLLPVLCVRRRRLLGPFTGAATMIIDWTASLCPWRRRNFPILVSKQAAFFLACLASLLCLHITLLFASIVHANMHAG